MKLISELALLKTSLYKATLLVSMLLISATSWARSAADYLPSDADLDPNIPTPESVLGWDVGDWHVSHDRLLQYMQILANASPRISLKVIGKTHEKRELIQLAITHEDNQARLETLRQTHLEGDGPLVVWLGYSIHGDEPSGSNASMLVAYYLAASRSAFVSHLLTDSVVLIDPSYNPDGLNRFASWANSNAGRIPVSDSVTRQHSQAWPEGRTNHYLFDLNRDWLLLVHPESRARLTEYHRWLPHVLTDHHEQDSYAGLFFQPGVPTRANPLIPAKNQQLTGNLAEFHAQALNQTGQPYFSKDAFDDFYIGKGSTYPDVNGSIGILFEQRAISGQALNTQNGVETFSTAVFNHLTMSLTTLQGAWSERSALQSYQSEFFRDAEKRAAQAGFAAWVVADDNDPSRANTLLSLFDQHQIEYQTLDEDIRADGFEFKKGRAWVFPVKQKQSLLLEAMMEQRTAFQDKIFYDVSAWTIPLAFNLPFAKLQRLPRMRNEIQASNGLTPEIDVVSWLIPWNQSDAPALLQKLHDAGALVRAANRPFSVQTASSIMPFDPGTLMVAKGIQDQLSLDGILHLISEAALSGLEVHTTQTMLSTTGPDLGSRHFVQIDPIKPVIIGGNDVSEYGAGEIWHLLDKRLGIAAPLVELTRFDDLDLSRYTHVLLASGNYAHISESQKAELAAWIKSGGKLITTQLAAKWAESLCFEITPEECESTISASSESPDGPPTPRVYSDFDTDDADRIVGGAIVASNLDLSHPLGFGFQRPELPLLRRGVTLLTPSMNSYNTPVRYSQDPLLAGFIGNERLQEIKGQPAVIAERRGKGLVVQFANNPLFRGIWHGTERLYVNALYFGQVVEPTDLAH